MKKKIDLSEIPQKNGHYDWKHSIGCSCAFEHTNVQGVLTILDYRSNGKISEVKISYQDIETWISTTQLRTGGIGGKLKIFSPDYQYEIGQIIRAKTDLLILARMKKLQDNRHRKIYTYKCLCCGMENSTTEAILRKGSGCPYCSGRKIQVGINDITTTDPWMIPFFKSKEEASKYTKGSMTEIFPYCPVCGKQQTKSKSIANLYYSHRSGCVCDTYMSFPEQVIFNLLLQSNIKFIHRVTQKELDWAQTYEYDFYLPDYHLIIEAHGAQHYQEHGFGTVGGKTLCEEQKNDSMKQELAEKNGLQYIAIDCQKSKIDYILKNINLSPLADIIDIENVNKDELYNNVLLYKKNLLKDMLKENNTYSKQQLQDKLHVSYPILIRLLDMINMEVKKIA